MVKLKSSPIKNADLAETVVFSNNYIKVHWTNLKSNECCPVVNGVGCINPGPEVAFSNSGIKSQFPPHERRITGRSCSGGTGKFAVSASPGLCIDGLGAYINISPVKSNLR